MTTDRPTMVELADQLDKFEFTKDLSGTRWSFEVPFWSFFVEADVGSDFISIGCHKHTTQVWLDRGHEIIQEEVFSVGLLSRCCSNCIADNIYKKVWQGVDTTDDTYEVGLATIRRREWTERKLVEFVAVVRAAPGWVEGIESDSSYREEPDYNTGEIEVDEDYPLSAGADE